MYRLVIKERRTALGAPLEMSLLLKSITKREAVVEALGQILALDRASFNHIETAFVGTLESYTGSIADPASYGNVVFLAKGSKHYSMSDLYWEVR